MNSYKELVKRCCLAAVNATENVSLEESDKYLLVAGTAAILAEVLRTLETVTPEMAKAYYDQHEFDGSPEFIFAAMLRASPLVQT